MFIGVDTHKDTLAVSCVDDAGQQVAHQSFANSSAGHAMLLSWARCHAPELERVGIEVQPTLAPAPPSSSTGTASTSARSRPS
jgi:transposase